ncbi:MAG: radical SAM protein [Methanomicrobiales archaeon]|nr:radical SAM protein [Methanomicrobiales archaeon]
MNEKAWIIDGYVDEPACLGVPPYISPYIRTLAGVFRENKVPVTYHTIDEIRKDPTLLQKAEKADYVVMIAGMTVPGKYLGGTPANWQEITQIGTALAHPHTFLGGPVHFGAGKSGGKNAIRKQNYNFDINLIGSPAGALHRWMEGVDPVSPFTYHDEDTWAALGAGIISQHPSYPHVMCEIETARGCSREVVGGCSFCTEPFYGKPQYRSHDGIIAEISALHKSGGMHFRIGRQPDILTWQAGTGEFPKPQPDLLEELFSSIRNVAPYLKTLHIDNVNPGTIVHHPDQAREALSAIVRYHTPGDIAAFGMETADPIVIEENNLKASPEMVLEAIRIVNELGNSRKDGIPELLPGLNFIAGLAGETARTYELNRMFLETVQKKGYLIRRINIRQLMPFEGTEAFRNNALPVPEKEFRSFKEWTRKNFDLPMLLKVYPNYTILRDVIIEEEGDISFGRQMGSYPILVGIPLHITVGTVIDVTIIGHGMRSLTALPYPIKINEISHRTIKWIPGVSKKGVARVLAQRPISTHEAFENATEIIIPTGILDFTIP